MPTPAVEWRPLLQLIWTSLHLSSLSNRSSRHKINAARMKLELKNSTLYHLGSGTLSLAFASSYSMFCILATPSKTPHIVAWTKNFDIDPDLREELPVQHVSKCLNGRGIQVAFFSYLMIPGPMWRRVVFASADAAEPSDAPVKGCR
jgi:hypothetical protein